MLAILGSMHGTKAEKWKVPFCQTQRHRFRRLAMLAILWSMHGSKYLKLEHVNLPDAEAHV